MNQQMRKILLLSGLALGLIAAAQPAFAQFYGGVGLGYSDVKIDDGAVPVTGATASTLSKDESDTGWKIFGGYSFNQNFAIEGGYVDLGKFNARRNATAPAAGTINADIDIDGWFVDIVGTAPLGNNFSIFGKAGVAYLDTSISASATGAVTILSAPAGSNEWSGKLGLGVQYNFTKAVAMRGEWERFFSVGNSTNGGGDVDLFSLNLLFKF